MTAKHPVDDDLLNRVGIKRVEMKRVARTAKMIKVIFLDMCGRTWNMKLTFHISYLAWLHDVTRGSQAHSIVRRLALSMRGA